MGHIRILTDQVANQIAAGEVVDRPASVVKELLENALDAGATRIRVEVEAGGRKLIRIADDGHGMNRDDALLAFERHATSKLRTADDCSKLPRSAFAARLCPPSHPSRASRLKPPPAMKPRERSSRSPAAKSITSMTPPYRAEQPLLSPICSSTLRRAANFCAPSQ